MKLDCYFNNNKKKFRQLKSYFSSKSKIPNFIISNDHYVIKTEIIQPNLLHIVYY